MVVLIVKIIQKQNGKLVCPNCQKEDFKIVDYGLSNDKTLGTYYFIVVCKNCKQKYKYFSDL
jgi:transposase-like protein